MRAGHPGLGGAVLPGRRPASSTWSSSTRRRRSGWPTRSVRWAGRRPRWSSVTPSRCRRRRSPSRRRRRRGDRLRRRRRVEDEESILTECVQARVPRQWLSWHYRSQDESLIAFCNAQYYENRLSSFPAPTARARVVRARRPRRLAGAGAGHVPPLGRRAAAAHQPDRGARRSSAEIRRRFDRCRVGTDRRRPVDRRRHVQRPAARLHRVAAPRRRRRPAGRRRSTAPTARACSSRTWRTCRATSATSSSSPPASPPTPTASLPLNFGPLNRVGGERRLNVAITRARRQVVVFSSFDPEQLRAEETSSVGIKHLRAYLDLAAQGTDVLPRGRALGVGRRPAPRGDRRRAARARAGRAHRRRAVGVPDRPVDLSTCRPGDAGDGGAARRAGVGAAPHGRRPRRAAGRGARRHAALAGGRAGVAAVVAGRPRPRSSTGWSPPSTRCRSAPVAEPIPLPTAAVESFKGVAALRASVTARWRCRSGCPAPKPRCRAKPAGPIGAGRRDAVRAVDPEDRRREVRARRAAGVEGRAGGAQGARTPASRPRARSTSTGWPS